MEKTEKILMKKRLPVYSSLTTTQKKALPGDGKANNHMRKTNTLRKKRAVGGGVEPPRGS